jgi:acyl-lipid omega-6 desaturase (Delta-12 desaturase)
LSFDPSQPQPRRQLPDWYEETRAYERPSLPRGLWQLGSTLAAYGALWALIVWMLRMGYPTWGCIPPILVASALLVRLFIFFHDCCHCSFFASYGANRAVGYLLGFLAFTPYDSWQRDHEVHHQTYADLDARGVGDIQTLTVREYLEAPWLKRLGYRLYRSPWIMFTLGPVYTFLVSQRFPGGESREGERFSVIFTDMALFALIMVLIRYHVLGIYLMIQLPIVLLAGIAGIWLFYVQHQFEGVYWSRHAEWDPLRAALEGSSYYRLPALLQWCTASIGIHTIHHIRPRIPNYNLQRCYDGVPALRVVKPLTLRSSLRSLRLHLWDEEEGRMVSFRSLRERGVGAEPA